MEIILVCLLGFFVLPNASAQIQGASQGINSAQGDSQYVNVTGDTMSGPLTVATGAGGIKVGNYAGLQDTADSNDLTNNLYYSSGWKYRNTSLSSLLEQYAGDFYFYTAPYGTADAAASLTERMKIANTGAVTIPGNAFSVGGSSLAVQYGKVGIGAGAGTSPQFTLDVYNVGASSYTNAIAITDDKTTNITKGNGLVWYSGIASAVTYHSGRIFSTFDTGSYAGARLSLQSPIGNNDWDNTLNIKNKNVGIGTTAPLTTLQVNGVGATTFITDTTGVGAGTGGILGLGGVYTGTSVTTYGQLVGSKATATDGVYSGNLLFKANSGTGLVEYASVRSYGGFRFYSRTMAQLLAITPEAVGEQFFCNNCTPAKMVVSTGTAAGNFADIMGGTFQ